jgi:type II secretory pathway component PulM
MPALPLGQAGPYVAAAYLVFLALILIYVGIMASKLARIERQATELNELAARRVAVDERAIEPAAERTVEPAERVESP